MNVFFFNRKFIYLALILLILIYLVIFYALSLKIALTKHAEVTIYDKNVIYINK